MAVYELGGGMGTCAAGILDHVRRQGTGYPEPYQHLTLSPQHLTLSPQHLT